MSTSQRISAHKVRASSKKRRFITGTRNSAHRNFCNTLHHIYDHIVCRFAHEFSRISQHNITHIITKNPIQNKSLFLIHFKHTGSSDLSFCKTAKNKIHIPTTTEDCVRRSLRCAQPNATHFLLVFGFSLRCADYAQRKEPDTFSTTQPRRMYI